MTGERPAHLDRCDICAERAVELGRWLEDVRATATEAADAAFPPERLLTQQQQIMRRLEQLDQQKRVIAFPSQAKLARDMGGRRVAAGWLAVAAAAGIVLGVAGAQTAGRLVAPAHAPQVVQAPQSQQPVEPTTHEALTSPSSTMLDENIDRVRMNALDTLDQLTPALVLARAGR